jgi:cyclase
MPTKRKTTKAAEAAVAARADAQAMRDMLATVAARVREQRRAGKRDSDVRTSGPAREFDGRYGGGFIKPEAFVQQMLDVTR